MAHSGRINDEIVIYQISIWSTLIRQLPITDVSFPSSSSSSSSSSSFSCSFCSASTCNSILLDPNENPRQWSRSSKGIPDFNFACDWVPLFFFFFLIFGWFCYYYLLVRFRSYSALLLLPPPSLPLCCSEQFSGSFRAVLGQSWGRFGVSFSVDSP